MTGKGQVISKRKREKKEDRKNEKVMKRLNF